LKGGKRERVRNTNKHGFPDASGCLIGLRTPSPALNGEETGGKVAAVKCGGGGREKMAKKTARGTIACKCAQDQELAP